MNDKIYISKEQLENLKKELKYLKSEGRKITAEKLKTALSFGDISENAEYDEATAIKERLEKRILELEHIIKSAKIIKDVKSKDKIFPGSTFELIDMSTNKKYTFSLVGFGDADPQKKQISAESPMGKELLNKKVGDIVKVKTPKGEISYKITKIIK